MFRLGPRWSLASLSLATLLPSLGTSIANAGLPAFADAFGASFQDIQWIVLAYLLAMTTLVVSAGRRGDLIGRRRLLVGGIILFTVASAVGAAVSSLWLLVAARAAQGMGAAVVMALSTALVGDLVPRDRTGQAMGLLATMSAVGTALGPSLGGLLIAGIGWRAIFAALAVLGLVAAIAMLGVPQGPATRQMEARRFDGLGTLLLAATLGAYALSMTLGHGQFGVRNAGLAAVAVIGFTLFALSQSKTASPLVDVGWLKQLGIRWGLVSLAIVSAVMMTTLVVGPFYLARVVGLGPAGVGLAMSFGPLMAALAAWPAGRLVDRIGPGRVMTLGLAGAAAGCATFAIVAATGGILGYLSAIGLITTGYAAFQAANNTSVISGVTAERRGTVSGLLGLARNLGLITGASAVATLFALASGGDAATATPSAIAGGTSTAFLVAAAALGALLIARIATKDRATSLRS